MKNRMLASMYKQASASAEEEEYYRTFKDLPLPLLRKIAFSDDITKEAVSPEWIREHVANGSATADTARLHAFSDRLSKKVMDFNAPESVVNKAILASNVAGSELMDRHKASIPTSSGIRSLFGSQIPSAETGLGTAQTAANTVRMAPKAVVHPPLDKTLVTGTAPGSASPGMSGRSKALLAGAAGLGALGLGAYAYNKYKSKPSQEQEDVQKAAAVFAKVAFGTPMAAATPPQPAQPQQQQPASTWTKAKSALKGAARDAAIQGATGAAGGALGGALFGGVGAGPGAAIGGAGGAISGTISGAMDGWKNAGS